MKSLEQVPTLLVKDEKLMDPTDVASVFNNFFATVTEKFNIQHTQRGDVISIINYSFPEIPQHINNPNHRSWNKKYNTIPKTKKSRGYDEITSKILNSSAPLISHTLRYIYVH